MDCYGLLSAAQGFFQTAFWALVVLGGFLLLRRSRGAGPRRRGLDPVARSLSVLNERYAHGEIDRDEYLERRAYLE